MKLTVAIVILATMTPLVLTMADDARVEISTSDSESEARVLADAIAQTFYGGEGYSMSLDLRIPMGESLEVGGSGGDEYTIRMIVNGEEAGRVYLDRPIVQVLGGVQSLSGNTTVSLTCERTGDGIGVRVDG